MLLAELVCVHACVSGCNSYKMGHFSYLRSVFAAPCFCLMFVGRAPKGSYSPRARSRQLLETPFSERLLRILLRTFFLNCKTHRKKAPFSEPFLERCVAVRPVRRAPKLALCFHDLWFRWSVGACWKYKVQCGHVGLSSFFCHCSFRGEIIYAPTPIFWPQGIFQGMGGGVYSKFETPRGRYFINAPPSFIHAHPHP